MSFEVRKDFEKLPEIEKRLEKYLMYIATLVALIGVIAMLIIVFKYIGAT